MLLLMFHRAKQSENILSDFDWQFVVQWEASSYFTESISATNLLLFEHMVSHHRKKLFCKWISDDKFDDLQK